MLHQALLHRALKLYRVAGEVDPSSQTSFSRSLVLVLTLTDPVPAADWQLLKDALLNSS